MAHLSGRPTVRAGCVVTVRVCSVKGCRRPHDARNYCHSHLARLYRGHPIGGPFPEVPLDRFAAKVEPDGDCWIWTGATDGRGRYGGFKDDETGRMCRAHRWAWVRLAGNPDPGDLVLDHLCRRTLCVNPDHLEAVTQRENILRGGWTSATNARKTHCPQGHKYSADNITPWAVRRGIRACLTCSNEYNARRRKAAA